MARRVGLDRNLLAARKRRVEKVPGGVTVAKRVALRGGEVGQKSDCVKCTCNAHALRPRRPPRPSTPPAGRQSRCPPPAAAIWPIRAHKAVTGGQGGWRSLADSAIGAAAAFVPETPPVLASGRADHAGYRPDRRRGQPLPYSRSAVSRNGCAAGDLTEVCRTHRLELGRRAHRPPLPLPCAQHNLAG